MKSLKQYASHIFIDGLSGMASGLFATLIVGTILTQIGVLIGGSFGKIIIDVAGIAKSLTGAGIAVGLACKYKAPPLVTAAAVAAGTVGAFAAAVLNGSIIVGGALVLKGPGEPLGAFIAAFTAIEVGRLISGKTKLDILLAPIATIVAGVFIGLLAGPPISAGMTALGSFINWGTELQPILMGILVSGVMGICLTLPISSAAIGIILGLSGLAGGAAVAGCSAQMVGFAVMSYRENKIGGLLAQGLGTSMLQIPNIVRKPIIWIPPIIASLITGPISTKILGMSCLPSGCGMGTSGFIGQFMTFESMTEAGFSPTTILIKILIVHFIMPALIALAISEYMRKKGWIKFGDMRLDV